MRLPHTLDRQLLLLPLLLAALLGPIPFSAQAQIVPESRVEPGTVRRATSPQ